MGHLPFPLVAAHFLFASMTKCKVSFPTQMTECRNKLNQTNNVLGSSDSGNKIINECVNLFYQIGIKYFLFPGVRDICFASY